METFSTGLELQNRTETEQKFTSLSTPDTPSTGVDEKKARHNAKEGSKRIVDTIREERGLEMVLGVRAVWSRLAGLILL